MHSKSIQSIRRFKRTQNISTSSQTGKPRTFTQAIPRAVPGPSASSASAFSFSTRKRQTPKSAPAGLPTSQSPPSKSNLASKAARPSRPTKVSATPPLSSSGQNQHQNGPFDDYIKEVLQRYKDPEDYMRVLKEDLAQYLSLQFDGTTYDYQWNGHVAQLVRVMEQLEKTGECVVAGQIIRP